MKPSWILLGNVRTVNPCYNSLMDSTISFDLFDSVAKAFSVSGQEMRTHAGRSVEQVLVDHRVHYLKRYWLSLSQLFKRHVARGLHELRMIDWLNTSGFSGPKVVRRGASGMLFKKQLFFLMEEVPNELALEAYWRNDPECVNGLSDDLANFAARLHDAGFVHMDFSERHILVGDEAGARSFRLIDVERAQIGVTDERRRAADLATLKASIADDRLRDRIDSGFVDRYTMKRKTLATGVDMQSLVAQAKPTKSF